MRRALAAFLAVGCAFLGAAVALLLAETTGLGIEQTTVLAPGTSEQPHIVPLPVRGPAAGFDPAAIYSARAGGVVTVYATFRSGGGSQGSGFVADAEGTILTNAHVVTDVARGVEPGDVRGADDVYIEFRDGERTRGRIVGWDLFSDVGVVRVDPAGHALQPLPLADSALVKVGEPVAAIGSPFGNQSSLSVGVVSATGRQIDSLTSDYLLAGAIQTDAPINRGNSGGPLFDARGRVVGINSQIRSTTGAAEGVGFAIPINVARRALEQLLRTGKVSYAYIGIASQNVTPGLAREFGLQSPRGALIARVTTGTPAAAAGLRGGSKERRYNGLNVTLGGDLIVGIAGKPVRSAEDVSRIVTEELLPGQVVPFAVVRDGARQVVSVKLAERPDTPG